MKCLLSADFLALETIPSLPEARAALQAIKELKDSHWALPPTWLSFSCKYPLHLCHGETFAEAVAELWPTGLLSAIGINCTSPELVTPLLESAVSRLPNSNPVFVVYPNSGQDWDRQQGYHGENKASEAFLASELDKWRRLGVRAVGGCCQLGPDWVRAVKKLADEEEGK